MISSTSPASDGRTADEPRILWLSGLAPHGVTSGLAMYTTGLTESLAGTGVDVVGVGIAVGDADAEPRVATWSLVGDRTRSRVRSLFSPMPYIAARLHTKEHLDAIRAVLDDGVDVVVFDHLMSAWCLSTVLRWRSETGGKIVHVAHNHESVVRTAWAESVALMSAEGAYLRFDARRIGRLERKLMSNVDLLTMITLDDRRSVIHDVPFDRSMVLAPGWIPRSKSSPVTPYGDRPRQVGLLGSFDWQAKRDNLEAVVLAMDAVFAANGIELVVIGSGDETFLAAQSGRWTATRFLGHVDDADEVLDSCRFGLVAEPVGGGFKLKALDYGFAGLPMAVLEGSLAGIDFEPGVEIVSAPTLEALAEAIVDVIDDDEHLSTMAAKVQERLEGRFEWQDRGALLASRLRDLAAGSDGSNEVHAGKAVA